MTQISKTSFGSDYERLGLIDKQHPNKELLKDGNIYKAILLTLLEHFMFNYPECTYELLHSDSGKHVKFFLNFHIEIQSQTLQPSFYYDFAHYITQHLECIPMEYRSHYIAYVGSHYGVRGGISISYSRVSVLPPSDYNQIAGHTNIKPPLKTEKYDEFVANVRHKIESLLYKT